MPVLDKDGDGVPNVFDLDNDNDKFRGVQYRNGSKQSLLAQQVLLAQAPLCYPVGHPQLPERQLAILTLMVGYPG